MRRPMSQASSARRSAHRADCLLAQKTGGRTGSRPKPPEAGARNAPALSPAERRATQTFTVAHPNLLPARGPVDGEKGCVGASIKSRLR